MRETWLLLPTLALALTAVAEETLFGLNAHFGWDEGVVSKSLEFMRQLGANAYRDGVNRRFWDPDDPNVKIDTDVIYPSVRQRGGDRLPYKAASLRALDEAKDFSIVYALNGTSWKNAGEFPDSDEARRDFAAHCRNVATRVRGRVAWYQVWNEWDGAHEMHGKNSGAANTPENYVKLLAEAAKAIREADPDAKVLANSFCRGDDSLFACFRLGMLKHCDAYAIHPYAPRRPPEEVIDRLRRVAAESAAYNGGVAKPFVITEMGWNNTRNGSTDAQTGDYAARLCLLLKTVPGYLGLTWYALNERTYSNVDFASLWGVVMPDLTPKESFYALQSVAEIVKAGRFVEELALPKDVHASALVFELPDGSRTLAAWSTAPEHRVQLVLRRAGGWQEPLSLVRCGSPAVRTWWGFRDQVFGQPWDVAEDPELFSFHASERPTLLKGLPDGFRLVRATDHDHTVAAAERMAVVPRCGGLISRQPKTLALDRKVQRIAYYGPWKGPDDFAVKMTYWYDDRSVHAVLDVTDDVLAKVTDEKLFWKRDSATLALAVVRNGKPIARFRQYFIYPLETGGTGTIAWNSKGKSVKSGAKLSFERTGDTGYRYSFEIPFADLADEEGSSVDVSLFGGDDTVLGFSANARDCDGAELKSGIQWGAGTTEGKNASPTMYGWMFFE